MADQAVQLSFEVGGEPPTSTLLRMSGGVFTHRELRKGEEIHVQVVDADGVVVADGYGRVVAVQFKDTLDKESGDVTGTERIHSVKVS
jgi:hypothetical protein